jgi:hypothetical protein
VKRVWWIVLLGAALGCLDSPTPGLLKINLTTPNSGADGAILLTVSGPGVLRSATPRAGLRLFSQSLTTTNHFAVTGTLTTGPILTVEVPDIANATSYAATIQQVAASNYQLRALVGYSVTVTP